MTIQGQTWWQVVGVALMLGVVPALLKAQPALIPRHLVPYVLDSGVRSGVGTEPVILFKKIIRIKGVPWLQLHFSDYNLGRRSYIVITSLLDGACQRLDARTLRAWQGSSAYFNGDAVEVELHVAPGDTGVFFKIQEITVGKDVSGGLEHVKKAVPDNVSRLY